MLFKRSLSLVVVLIFVLGLAACTQAAIPQLAPTEEASAVETTTDEHAVHWGYEGEGAPEHWGDLDADYETCATGMEQSPIDIPADAPANAANLHFDYNETAVKILNNGHTVQVDYDDGSRVEIDDEPYDLKQFHFHAASENTLAGEHTPMEMHLVHTNAAGEYAVVAVMLTEGEENTAYASVFDNMPTEEVKATAVPGATVNALALLPNEQSYYRFDGSLTTPKCNENVKWHVMDHPVELSADQIAQFTNIFDNNFRPTQPMNDREFIVLE